MNRRACLLLILLFAVATLALGNTSSLIPLWQESGSNTISPIGGKSVSIKGTLSQLPPEQNSDDVVAGGYKELTTDTANWGGGATSREHIQLGQINRLRQGGTVTKIRAKIANHASMTGITFAIWRYNGATYDLVGRSDDFRSLITGNDAAEYDISDIEGVLPGDYYGYRVVLSGSANIFAVWTGQTGSTIARFDSAAAKDDGTDWGNPDGSYSGYLNPVEVYVDNAPAIVFIGDSLIAGHGGNYSYCETTATNDLDGSMPYHVALQLGVTDWQNMGVGGSSSTTTLARFERDCTDLHPKIAVIGLGTNDVVGSKGVTDALWLSNWRTMLDYCQNNDIVPVILQSPPATGYSIDSAATSDGAGDGSTVIDSALSTTNDYYNGWTIYVGSESTTVADYDGSTKTLTMTSNFSGQVTSSTAYFLTAMLLRASRKEALAALASAYPTAIIINSDYVLGQNESNANAAEANLWDIKTAYLDGTVHLNAAGYQAWGEYIASEIKRVGKW